MLKTLLFIWGSLTFAVYSQQTVTVTIEFDKDEYVIRSSEKEKLNSLIDSLLFSWDVKEIELAGHTDSDASDTYNRVLSKNRVNAVESYLVNRNVDKPLITSSFFGEKKPIKSNNTADGQQSNRRVEITVRYEIIEIELEEITPAVKLPDCTVDTLIVLPGGTMYRINKCFYEANPNCVSITSFLDPASAQARGLETQTEDGSPLVSGGMIDYEICDDREVEVLIPMNSSCPTFGMNAYTLNEDGSWTQTSDAPLKQVEINSAFYYSVPLSGSGSFNCDKLIPSVNLQKVKIKSKRGIELDYATLSCDCQFFVFGNEPKNKRKRKIVLGVLCCPELMVSISAKTTDGEVLIMERQPIDELDNKNNLGSCPQDIKWQWWIFSVRNKGVYRKYKVGLEDFQ